MPIDPNENLRKQLELAARLHNEYFDDVEFLNSLSTELAGLVLELNDFLVKTRFYPEAWQPTFLAASAYGAPPGLGQESPPTFRVEVTDLGESRTKVLSFIRKLMDLDLLDLSQFAKNLPQLIGVELNKFDAEKLQRELEALGAKVQVTRE